MKGKALFLGLAFLVSSSFIALASDHSKESKPSSALIADQPTSSVSLSTHLKEYDSSDDFDSKEIRPQWETTNNNTLSLTERPGYLRLKSTNSVNSSACQVFQSVTGIVNGEIAVLIAIDELSEGTTAGISLQSNNNSSIGVQKTDGKIKVISVNDAGEVHIGPLVESQFVVLKTTISNNKINYEYSIDLCEFFEIGDSNEISSTIDTKKLGLFCFNPSGRSGAVDVDWFYSKITSAYSLQ